MVNNLNRQIIPLMLLASSPAGLGAPDAGYSFDQSQIFLNTYCRNCHQGKSAGGGFDIQRVHSSASLQSDPQKWISLNKRVRNGEMPPKGAPAPGIDEREQFTGWVDSSLRAADCAS